MPQLTIVFGIVLILTGFIAYFGTGQESVTALLPTIAGIPIGLAGILATRSERERTWLYIAGALVAILALGTLRGVIALIGGDTTTATVINTGLFILSAVYLVVFVYMLRVQTSTHDAS